MPDAKNYVPELPPAKYLDRDGCRLAYFTLGDRSGVPLVLCHGLAATGLQFVSDAHWFAAHGFFVVVPDVRGHGRSRLVQSVEQTNLSVPVLADDMLAVLDAEALDRVHWVGNSLGGIIALEIIGRQPERLESLITFGTSYRLGLPKMAVAVTGMMARMAGQDILASIFAPMTCRAAEGQAVIAAMLKQTDVEAAVAVGHEVHDYDLIDNARLYEKPILLLRCDLDTQVNWALDSTLTVMQGRSNFTLVDIKDAGHCANLDQPEIVRRQISTFIAGQSVGGRAVGQMSADQT